MYPTQGSCQPLQTHTHTIKKCQSKAIAQDLFGLYGPFFHQHKVFLSWKAVNSIPFIFLCHLPSPPWSIQCQSLSGLRPHIQSLSSRAGDSAQKCWCNCGWLWSSTELSQLQHLDELEKLIKYAAMRAVWCSLKPCQPWNDMNQKSLLKSVSITSVNIKEHS